MLPHRAPAPPPPRAAPRPSGAPPRHPRAGAAPAGARAESADASASGPEALSAARPGRDGTSLRPTTAAMIPAMETTLPTLTDSSPVRMA